MFATAYFLYGLVYRAVVLKNASPAVMMNIFYIWHAFQGVLGTFKFHRRKSAHHDSHAADEEADTVIE